MNDRKLLLFEIPLPDGGQFQVTAYGIWSEDDCNAIEEFVPIILKSMRRRVTTAAQRLETKEQS